MLDDNDAKESRKPGKDIVLPGFLLSLVPIGVNTITYLDEAMGFKYVPTISPRSKPSKTGFMGSPSTTKASPNPLSGSSHVMTSSR
jgi:hypothetical protein